MAVAAHLDMEAADRRAAQIGGHDAGRPAIKRERRLQHAAIAQRHQVGLPGGIGGAKNADRIRSIRTRPPGRMLIPGHSVTPSFAGSLSLRPDHPRQVRCRLSGGESRRFYDTYPPVRAMRPDCLVCQSPAKAKTRFQSFFMLMTTQRCFIASSYRAWLKVPTLVSGSPSAGP